MATIEKQLLFPLNDNVKTCVVFQLFPFNDLSHSEAQMHDLFKSMKLLRVVAGH